MKGDFTRFTFYPVKNYTGVRLQQGRVMLDADWNEQVDIQNAQSRKLAADLIGEGAVLGTGFEIRGAKSQGETAPFYITSGRIYVDGLLVENWNEVAYDKQKYYHSAPPLQAGTAYEVYLDAWEREVTAASDNSIAEPALNGADTTIRTQCDWQVKVKSPNDPLKLATRICSTGTLSAKTLGTAKENRLYRVEAHRSGNVKGNRPDGNMMLKWSRENASVIAACKVEGGTISVVSGQYSADDFRGPDFIYELVDDVHEYGVLIGIDDKLKMSAMFAEDASSLASFKKNLRVRRWDGLIKPDTLQAPNKEGVWFNLGEDIMIQLADTTNDGYVAGDYWLVRTSSNEVLNFMGLPPHGVMHYYCSLGSIEPNGDVKSIRRPRPLAQLDKALTQLDTLISKLSGGLSSTNSDLGLLLNAIKVDTKNNVGIGTSTPSAKLDVRGSLSATNGNFEKLLIGSPSATGSRDAEEIDALSRDILFNRIDLQVTKPDLQVTKPDLQVIKPILRPVIDPVLDVNGILRVGNIIIDPTREREAESTLIRNGERRHAAYINFKSLGLYVVVSNKEKGIVGGRFSVGYYIDDEEQNYVEIFGVSREGVYILKYDQRSNTTTAP